MVEISAADMTFIAQFLHDQSGLVITPDKGYLLESRLAPIARQHGCASVSELIGRLRSQRDNALSRLITEAMTTNESFFFRDQKPFDHFKAQVLPYLLDKRRSQKSFRIWCAAASSGQEPYSLAMILREAAGQLAGWKVDILGTDISRPILDRARGGLYSQFEVQRGLPIQLLVKYFKKKEERWQIDDSIRAMVQFREFNLLSDPRALGTFDVVMCRNVLIYFDPPTKKRVLNNLSSLMVADGFLYLGGAETIVGLTSALAGQPNERGVYRPQGRP